MAGGSASGQAELVYIAKIYVAKIYLAKKDFWRRGAPTAR